MKCRNLWQKISEMVQENARFEFILQNYYFAPFKRISFQCRHLCQRFFKFSIHALRSFLSKFLRLTLNLLENRKRSHGILVNRIC